MAHGDGKRPELDGDGRAVYASRPGAEDRRAPAESGRPAGGNLSGPASRRGRRVLWAGLAASLVVHLLVWGLGPELRFPVPDALQAGSRLVVLPPMDDPPPPVVEVPAAPEPIARPAEPVAAEPGGEPEEADGPPPFIPHDVRPRLTNASFIREYLEAFYPPTLRTSGMQARVRLWLFVNEDGEVEKVRLQSSSGLPEFDRLAVSSASVMDFRPALSGDQTVGVWVEQWIRFQVVSPESTPIAAESPGRR